MLLQLVHSHHPRVAIAPLIVRVVPFLYETQYRAEAPHYRSVHCPMNRDQCSALVSSKNPPFDRHFSCVSYFTFQRYPSTLCSPR